MKRLICILFVALCAYSCSSVKGNNDTLVPRYKLYNTENVYNLLRLDTATGAIWMVQYGMNENVPALVAPIDDTSLLTNGEDVHAGRFELYPTKNMYTFILLDVENGSSYQVQWHQDAENRFRVRID